MPKVKELHQYMAQCLAECFSTFMLILIGEAGIAQYKFARNGNHSPITVNLSFAIGVYTGNCLLLIYVSFINDRKKNCYSEKN
jgi:glycerol uptake facilitator-like aquaporin